MKPSEPGIGEVRRWHLAVPKGRIVYDTGDPAISFYRVEEGCIRLQLMSADGRRKILAFCLPGDIFGLEVGHPHFEGAEATVDSQLSRFAAASVTQPPLDVARVIGALGAASDMIVGLFTHLDGLGRGSAEDRLMWFLDWLADRQEADHAGGRVSLPMDRRDIADYLGLAPETLSRTFARLEARQLVEVGDAKTLRLRSRKKPAKSGGGYRDAPPARPREVAEKDDAAGGREEAPHGLESAPVEDGGRSGTHKHDQTEDKNGAS